MTYINNVNIVLSANYFLYLVEVGLDLGVDLGGLMQEGVECHWRVPFKEETYSTECYCPYFDIQISSTRSEPHPSACHSFKGILYIYRISFSGYEKSKHFKSFLCS